MCISRLRAFVALMSAAIFLLVAPPLRAQQSGGDQKTQDQGQKPPPPPDAAKEEKKKIDPFAEAARLLGGPASNPECLWLGTRVVRMLYQDDLDTAFRHLDLYDRFGCPGGHIQMTFRCVVRQGSIDPNPKGPIDTKVQENLNTRVQACWVNPGLQPSTTATVPGTTSNQ